MLAKLVFAGLRLPDGGKAMVGLPPPDVVDGVRNVDPKGSDEDVLMAPAVPAAGKVAANDGGGLLRSKTSNGDGFTLTAGGGWLAAAAGNGSRREAADRDCAMGFSVVGVNTSNGDDFDCVETTDDADDLSETVVALVLNKSRGLGFATSEGTGADTGTAGVDCEAKESKAVVAGVDRPRGIGTRSGGCNKGAMPLVGL